MNFSSKQLSNGRWGIYAKSTLLASIGSYNNCKLIVSLLEARITNKLQPSLPTKKWQTSNLANDYCLRQLILEISDSLNTRLEKLSQDTKISQTELAKTILSQTLNILDY
jgi:hypothetical protein